MKTTDRLPPEAPKIVLDETALYDVQIKIDKLFNYRERQALIPL